MIGRGYFVLFVTKKKKKTHAHIFDRIIWLSITVWTHYDECNNNGEPVTTVNRFVFDWHCIRRACCEWIKRIFEWRVTPKRPHRRSLHFLLLGKKKGKLANNELDVFAYRVYSRGGHIKTNHCRRLTIIIKKFLLTNSKNRVTSIGREVKLNVQIFNVSDKCQRRPRAYSSVQRWKRVFFFFLFFL